MKLNTWYVWDEVKNDASSMTGFLGRSCLIAVKNERGNYVCEDEIYSFVDFSVVPRVSIVDTPILIEDDESYRGPAILEMEDGKMIWKKAKCDLIMGLSIIIHEDEICHIGK